VLNFAEQTGSGAVTVVWSFLNSDLNTNIKCSARLQIFFGREKNPGDGQTAFDFASTKATKKSEHSATSW
jgi:hypothetical protein